MNKNWMLDIIRNKYPDIKWLKKYLAKDKIRKYTNTMLPNDQVERSENDFVLKQRVVSECQAKWAKIYASTEKKIRNIIERAPSLVNRTDKDDLRIDMLFCRFAYGFQPDEYLCYELEGKSMQERKAIISDTDRYCYVYRMNDISGLQLFNNKGRTYEMFKKYYKREAVYLSKRKDYDKFCAFIQKHPVFVRKAVYEGMGRTIGLVDISTCEMSAQELFQDMLAHGPHIIEECVIQNEVMAALNPSSVNTIRCITLKTSHGIAMPYCFMKIGRLGSFVDNGGAGGILVGIDKETGRLNTDGFDELNIRYESHPESGIRFIGYQLPEWDSMLAICKEMSSQVSDVKYIGWDMAYTDNGWVVIEGNSRGQFIGPQTVFKCGIKAEVESIMADMDLIV